MKLKSRYSAKEFRKLLSARNFTAIRSLLEPVDAVLLADVLREIPIRKVLIIFRLMTRRDATKVFSHLPVSYQEGIMEELGDTNVAQILNEMPPDDRTALLEVLPIDIRKKLLDMLTPEERAVASKLLAFPRNSVGRRMTPDYIAVHPDWTIGWTLEHIRNMAMEKETINMIYVIDEKGVLIDDISLKRIILTAPEKKISDIMDYEFRYLNANVDQEIAVEMFKKHDRIALPVVNNERQLIGIVTVDDVLDIQEEEVTEDIQKFGAVEVMKEPYLDVPFFKLVQKRAGWLTVLFLGEMLTATAMGFFEKEIVRAVVLVLFIPLIISSGGNSGSQASTLIIRAMALGEVSLRDWWRIIRREFFVGLALGCILGIIGFSRIALWNLFTNIYGEYWLFIAITIFITLSGVVLWGTLVGSMLPLVLKRLGTDPAVSSAPFVATLVDVSGLVIYFGAAMALLHGKLL